MTKTVPDFSQAGSDGTLPGGFKPWRWSVAYTVRPELLSPLEYGREYTISARLVRKLNPGYEFLYERATAIAKARIAQLKPSARDEILHTRIRTHGWFRDEARNITSAWMAVGVTCLKQGDAKPDGEKSPAPQELAAPGGMTPANFTPEAAAITKNCDELYSDVDVRDESEAGKGVFTMSYGEYANTCSGIDFRPYVRRAEALASWRAGSDSLNIIRREWLCAANPDIAVVHLYIET